MDQRTCPQCGGPVVRPRGQRGPIPTYCSASCKSRAAHQRVKADGRYAAQLAASAARSAAERAANARPCPYCDAPMEDPRRVQCGAPECERRFNNERTADWLRGYKERAGEPYRYKYEHEHTCEGCGKSWTSREPGTRFCSIACHNQTRRWDLTCEVCGVQWPSGRADARFCSPACRGAASSTALRAGRSQLALYTGPRGRRSRMSPPAILLPLRKRWYAGFCAECGTPFIHDQPQTITCTAACSRRWYGRFGKAKRRAVKKSAFVENVYRRKVFERDRWICQLCRKPVARTKAVPHPKAPVLDHIIPLAVGGTHEPSNVQCAHYLCNSLKGARGGGEQLLLIG